MITGILIGVVGTSVVVAVATRVIFGGTAKAYLRAILR